MNTAKIAMHVTEEQRDWLIALLCDQLEENDEWDDEAFPASVGQLLDALLLTKGQRRYTVTAQSETTVVVEATDETAAREAAIEHLAGIRTRAWTVQRVQAQRRA